VHNSKNVILAELNNLTNNFFIMKTNQHAMIDKMDERFDQMIKGNVHVPGIDSLIPTPTQSLPRPPTKPFMSDPSNLTKLVKQLQ
jgi:hypothetical protein